MVKSDAHFVVTDRIPDRRQLTASQHVFDINADHYC